MASALVTTDLPDLTLISRGKVRDIYRTSAEDCLLFVATDRISVFDVILTKVGDLCDLVSTAVRCSLRTTGYPRQGEGLDENFAVLVRKAKAHCSQSSCDGGHRSDARGNKEIWQSIGGSFYAREKSQGHPYRVHCTRVSHR